MPIRAQLFDGTVLEFPDNTDPGVIQSTAKRMTAEIKGGMPAPERTFGDTAKDIGITALKGAIGLPQAFVGLADIPTGGRVGKALEGAGLRFSEAQKALEEAYSPAQKEAMRRVSEAKGFLPTVKEAVMNPSVPLAAIGESLPQMLGGAGIARGLISKGIPAIAAVGAGEGVLGAGSAAAQMRAESPEGLLTPKQSLAALGLGAGTAVLGAAGAKFAKSLGLADVDTLIAKGGAEAAQAANAKTGFMRSVVGSGLAEGAFEEMPQSAQEQMWQNWAGDKPIFSGVPEAAAMGLVTGTVMGGTAGGISAMAKPEAPKETEFDKRRKEMQSAAPAAQYFDQASPLENPYGNIPADLMPDVTEEINAARSKRKQAPLDSFSIEDVVNAGIPQERVDTLLSGTLEKAGLFPDQEVAPQDVLDAAADRGINPDQPGFRDFLRRATGSENLDQMSPVQRVAAFGAIQNLPEGVDALPTGTNARSFTEAQYKKGLKAIRSAISGGASRDSLLARIHKAGIKNPQDAQSILQNAIREGQVGAISTPAFAVFDDYGKVVRTYDDRGLADRAADRLNGSVAEVNQTSYVPPGQTEISAGEATGYQIKVGDSVLAEAKTPEEIDQKADRLGQIRERIAASRQNKVDQLRQQAQRNTEGLEELEARGLSGTPKYAKKQKQIAADNAKIDRQIGQLTKEAEDAARPMFVSAIRPKVKLAAKAAPAKPAAKPTEAPEIAALRQKLLPALRRFGLEGVGLRVVKSIEDGGAGADGAYANRLIQIALSAENPMGVMRHEVIHALKELGAFKPREWRALEKQAKSEWIGKFIEQPGLMERYQQVYQEQTGSLEGFDEYIAEEAIAEAFKYFDQTKPPVGLIGNLFNRLRNFFASLRNAMQGAGFQTAEDVLGRIEEGKVKPVKAEAPAAAEARYSVKPTKKRDTDVTRGADEIAAMDADVRDDTSPSDMPGGYHAYSYYEARKLQPKPSTKLKRVTENNSHVLWESADYIANVDGELFSVTKQEDPDDPDNDDAFVYAFERLSDPVKDSRMIETIVSTPEELFDEIRDFMGDDLASLDKESWEKEMRKRLGLPPLSGTKEKKSKFSLITDDKRPFDMKGIRIYNREIEALVKKVGDRIAGMQSGKTLADVKAAVNKLRQYSKEGSKGAEWYERSAKAVLDMFNGDKVLAEKFFQIIAITSANTEVAANFTKTYNAWRQFAENKPIKAGTQNENKKIEALLYFGIDWDGRKTNTFYKNLMEAMEGTDSGRSTIDLHMARMLFDRNSPTDAQYQLAENMVRLLATKAKFPARQVQAASWVTQKAKTLFSDYRRRGLKKKLSDKELREYAFERAIVDYAHLIERKKAGLPVTDALREPSEEKRAMTQTITGEAIPSVKTEMGEIASMSRKIKTEITDNVINQNFVDKIAQAIGVASRVRTTTGSGGYEGAITPNIIVQVVNKNPEIAEIDARAISAAMMYVFKQDAVPFFKADPRRIGMDQFGYKIKFARDKLTATQEKKLFEALRGIMGSGAGYTKMAGNEMVMINYRGEDGNPFLMPDGAFVEAIKQFRDAAENITGVGEVEQFGVQSEYPYHDWENDPSGAGLIFGIQGSAGGRPAIQQRLDNLRKSFVDSARESVRSAGITPKFSLTASGRRADDPRYGRRVTTDTIDVDGQERPTRTSSGTLIFPTEEGVRNFWRWFGDSVFVDDQGRPMVMYHGTAADIDEFIPRQANAIFITPRVGFAADFNKGVLGGVATWSEGWMVDNYEDILTPEQIERAKLKALSEIDAETKKDYKLTPKSHHSAFVETAEFNQALLDEMPSRANVIPLFVKAENPFNYDNPNHIRQVVDRLFLDSGVDLETDPNGLIRFEDENGSIADKQYSENEVYKMLSKGYWPLIEQKETQEAIRGLGFDGFSVQEALTKNYAVYDSSQLKSAVGNTGEFSPEKKGIRYSISSSRELFDPKEIKKHSHTPNKGRTKLIDMNIDDFLRLSTPGYVKSKEADVEKALNSGEKLRELPSIVAYQEDGKGDLIVDGNNDPRREGINNHEGRHRARALKKRGYSTMPVLLTTNIRFSEQQDPEKFDYIEDWPKKIIGYDGNTAAFPVKREDADKDYQTPEKSDIRYSIAQTKTPEFKRWFGESKAVDAQGNPNVFWRGDAPVNSQLDKPGGFLRSDVKREGIQHPDVIEINERRPAIYLSDESRADWYATSVGSQNYARPFYVRAINTATPEILRELVRAQGEGFDGNSSRRTASHLTAAEVELLKANGYDSIEGPMQGGGNELAVFSPEQIKSAVGNRGTFDANNPNIRFSFRNDIKSKLGQGALSAIDRTTSARQGNFSQRLASAFSPDSFTKLRRQMVNKYAALERNSKRVADRYGESRLLADQSAIAAALMSDRAAGIAAESFKNGVPVYAKGYTKVDDLGGKVKGLIPILEPLMKYNDPFVFQAFQFYSATRRGARLLVEGREKLLTPQDIRFGKQLEQTYPEFKAAFDEYQKYNRGLVKFLVDTGVLSEEMGKKWAMYADYIPFYRQADGEETIGPQIFNNLAGVKPTQRLKGGEFKLDDFLETVVRNTRSAIEQGMKNVAAQRAVKDAIDLNSPGKNDYAKRMPPGTAGAPDIVTVREKGKDVQYQVADPLLVETMKGLYMPNPYETILKIVGFPTRMLRELVTKMPDFMLANLMRDSMSAWVTSGTKFKPVIDSFKQAGNALVGSSPEIKAIKAAGIGTGYEFSGDVKSTAIEFAKELRKASGKRKVSEIALLPVTKVWDLLDAGSNASDLATRAEIHKRTMEETGNEAEAAFRALEVMNFSRMGSSPLVQILSATVPFFNARVQGLDLLYRAGMGDLAQANRDAAHKAFKVRALTLFALSIAYWMMASDSDEYKKANEETRDNNWIIGSVRIPIPFEIGVLFKVIPERMMGYLFGTDTGKDVKESAKRNIISTLSMNPVPQAVLPILENYIDYSFFTGRGIIPRGMEDVAPQFQETSGTSILAKKIGAATEYSPIKVDNLINGYFGAFGTYMSMGIDSMLRTASDPVKPAMGLEQMPVIKRFYASPLAGGTKEAFFDLKDRIGEVTRTQNFLMESGRYEELAAYMKENGKLIDAKSWVSRTDKELKNVRGLIRATSNLTERDITPEEKREALNSLRRSENYLTEQSRILKKNLMQ